MLLGGPVSQKFLKGWLHPDKPVPMITRIFYVAYSTDEGLEHLGRFSDYWCLFPLLVDLHELMFCLQQQGGQCRDALPWNTVRVPYWRDGGERDGLLFGDM